MFQASCRLSQWVVRLILTRDIYLCYSMSGCEYVPFQFKYILRFLWVYQYLTPIIPGAI